jgi:hypothetical protein
VIVICQKYYNLVIYFGNPAAKLSLLLLSIDRLYAVLSPVKYRSRNHLKFSMCSLSVVYTLALALFLCIIITEFPSAAIFETCITGAMRSKVAYVTNLAVICSIDVATYICQIVMYFLIRRSLSSIQAHTNAGIARELERQVR